MNHLTKWLEEQSNEKHYLFKTSDLRSLLGHLSDSAFRTQLSRAVKKGVLSKVCQGIYLYEKTQPHDGLLLFRVANLLRANAFNYISLETILSNNGVISQIPVSRLFIITSGKANMIDCNKYGSIEFVHSTRKPDELKNQLTYNEQYGMWQANVKLALADMKRFRRNLDLIDWDAANEFI